MNNLQIFIYGGEQLRTVQREDGLWWVLRDVCRVLNIGNVTDTKKRLDPDEVDLTDLIDSMGRVQATTIINEPGLYSVILRSDKPEAKEFKHWVTHEVLPSIRRTGGYIAGQKELSPDELMAKALLVAQKTLADREAQISNLTVQNQIMAPKADYFDEIVDRNLLTNFRETAKQLGIGEKSFIAFLLEKKYIYRDKRGKLMPYAEKNTGLFEMKECFNEKTQWAGTQTLITPKGRETFRLLVK